MTKRSSDSQLDNAFKRISLKDPILKILSYDSFQKVWLVELQSGKKEHRAFKDLSHESIFETYIHRLLKKSPPKSYTHSPTYIT